MTVSHFQRGREVRFEQGNPCFRPLRSSTLEGFRKGQAISLRRKGIHQDDLNANRILRRQRLPQLPPECLNGAFRVPRGAQGLLCTFGERPVSHPETMAERQRLLSPLDRPLVLCGDSLLPLGEEVERQGSGENIGADPPVLGRHSFRSMSSWLTPRSSTPRCQCLSASE